MTIENGAIVRNGTGTMARTFKRFSSAQAAANGNPIVRIDDLYIVIDRDLTGIKITQVELLASGRIVGQVGLGHLNRLGNANYAIPETSKHGVEHIEAFPSKPAQPVRN